MHVCIDVCLHVFCAHAHSVYMRVCMHVGIDVCLHTYVVITRLHDRHMHASTLECCVCANFGKA